MLDSYFPFLIGEMHAHADRETKLLDLKFPTKLVRYAKGEIPEGGQTWAGCRYLYIPVCERCHWILLKVDIKERTIYVYDSMVKRLRKNDMQKKVVPLSILIPLFLKMHVDGFSDHGILKYELKNVTCPQQDNGYVSYYLNINIVRYLFVNLFEMCGVTCIV